MNLVFQKDFNDSMDEYMVEAEKICKDLDITFCPIVIVPFEHTVVDDSLLKTLAGNSIAYGSNVISDIVHHYDLNPGLFHITDNEAFTLSVLGSHYLNADMIFCTTENILDVLEASSLKDEEFFFMKPKDAKYFPGTIVDRKMIPFVIESQGKHFGTPESYDICVSTIKRMISEWRFFVVGNSIVAGSKYHTAEMRLDIQPGYPEEVKLFAEEMIETLKKVSNDDCYVIDIAEMETGEYKVVELNCLNNSGFYACDMRSIFEALKRKFK